jgi:hypothetical protein
LLTLSTIDDHAIGTILIDDYQLLLLNIDQSMIARYFCLIQTPMGNRAIADFGGQPQCLLADRYRYFEPLLLRLSAFVIPLKFNFNIHITLSSFSQYRTKVLIESNQSLA